ncbi:MAG: hypothetical protein GY846_22010 [Deltaproteobacteria bacterium]|nr:hypothetical protein [Deltaproteobacteria bacterium]
MAPIGRNNSKNISHKGMLFSILTVIIFTWVLLPVSQASAETRKSKVNNQMIRFEYIPILDTPGHIIGIFERQGDVLFEDGEKAKQILRGTVDMNRGRGTFQAYSLTTYEDGSTTILKNEGSFEIPPGGKLPVSKGKGKFIKGTGRFQGIKGTASFKGKQTKPYGGEYKADQEVEVTATYTLPGK